MVDKKPCSIVLGALEGTEAYLDFVTSNEAVRAVPVVSTAIRILEGVNDYRSRLLQSKLKRFLTEPSLVRSLKARELRGEIVADEDDAARIGDTLFLIIDRVTDSEKPILLAKVYAYYLDGSMSSEDFFLLAHCIDISALSDLQDFIASRGLMNSAPDARQLRLVTSGLLRSDVTDPTTFPSAGGHSLRLLITITELGELLVMAIDAADAI